VGVNYSRWFRKANLNLLATHDPPDRKTERRLNADAWTGQDSASTARCQLSW
jgi:hypothetical protein